MKKHGYSSDLKALFIFKVLIFLFIVAFSASFALSSFAASRFADGNKVRYLLEDGSVADEYFEIKNGKYYYMTEDGSMVRDNVIAALDDNYYVFDKDGAMLVSTSVNKNGTNWVIDADGVAVPEQSEEELILLEHANELVKPIKNSELSDYEKAKAVFALVWDGFSYTAANETDLDTVEAAMKGFDLNEGNCYVLYAKAHYLFAALGYKDMLISGTNKDGRFTNHWWQMVKIGDKYYHFDATPFNGFNGWNLVTTKELHDSSSSDEMAAYLHLYKESNFPKSY